MKNKLFQLLLDNKAAGGARGLRAEASDTGVAILLSDVIDAYYGANTQALQAAMPANDVPFTLYLNSPGGDVFEARDMAALIARHGAPVDIIGTGVVASAATYLALAGRSFKMTEGGLFMVHESWTFAYGNKGELRQTADLLEKVDGTIAGDYQRKTGASAEQVDAWMKAETWFTAQEAVDAKFADAVVPNTQAGAQDRVTWNLSAYNKAPTVPEPAIVDAVDEAVMAANRAKARAHMQFLVTNIGNQFRGTGKTAG